ncbi:hypothetical protein L226DRAFT_563890 [Lentinus tigrinus ALCF2SS1-7]|uniref:uncharacterized protein n=1 Tax=Lentinus tigrinus ALCF2SS1-7 TaxID=1328758 RepID=UPI001165F94F|nr:hypothetical protein L226DRAFT_563890 [Lentinus tigrinus ALCF2SS1-7]
MPSHTEQLNRLEKRLTNCMLKSRTDEDFDASFYALLKSNEAKDLWGIVDKAGSILDKAIDWAYGDGDYDFLKSFAHSDSTPLVQDTAPQPVGQGIAKSFLALLQRIDPGSVSQGLQDRLISSPWTASYRPHPKSTRLSLFRDGANASTTKGTPIARTMLQARCEISSDDFPCPVNAAIAKDSSVLAVVGQGGWKNRDPVLSLYILDETEENSGGGAGQSSGRDSLLRRHYRTVVLEPGLSEVTYQVAMDTLHVRV